MENEGIQQEQPQGVDYEKLASILDGRQAATEDKVLKGYFREQGMSGDEMAQAIEAFKSQRASQQPDIAGMQESIAQLQQEIEKATKAANRAKVENAVIIEATKMGIDPKAIPYLTRMADLTNVGDEAGNVSAEKVAAALGKVLEDLPALKPTVESAHGFRVGGAGDKNAQPPTDDAALRHAFGLK
ncbi:MAG: hypothetical protein IKG69_08495 [Atopobiaceae bacterium]|nr:hypothetical protein [Atopobiaceae bacterium]